MLVLGPTENDNVKQNEVITFKGKDMTYTVSLYPLFRRSGEDDGGQFKIIPEGQSSAQTVHQWTVERTEVFLLFKTTASTNVNVWCLDDSQCQ